MNNNFDNLFLDLNPFAKLNPIVNPNIVSIINTNTNTNTIENPLVNNSINYFNNNFSDILKTQINKEFRDYIVNNFKDKNIYSINDCKLSFKLKNNNKNIIIKI